GAADGVVGPARADVRVRPHRRDERRPPRAHLRPRAMDRTTAAGGRVQRLRGRRKTSLARTSRMSSSRPVTTRAALTSALGTVAGLLVALALMVGFFSWQSEYFFTADTFITIANDIPAVAVTAVGMTFVLIIAGIDLSVGSTMALAAAVAGIAMLQWHWSLLPATFLAMAVGVVVGAINGAVTVVWRLPSFIVTLGMLEMARGAAYLATDSRTQYIGGKIDWLGKPFVLGLSPQFFIAIAIVAGGQGGVTRTRFGRRLVGIGTNEEAMRLAGVDPRPLKVIVFALAGLLA